MKFVKQLIISYKVKKLKLYNILILYDGPKNIQMLSEIQVLARNCDQAMEIANFRIKKVNAQLNSKFYIEKCYELNTKDFKLQKIRSFDNLYLKNYYMYYEHVKYLKNEFMEVLKIN